MKVGIDISALNLEHQYRGVGTYTGNLIRALQSVQKSDFSIQLISAKGGSAAGGKQVKITNDYDLVHYPHFDLFFLTLPLHKFKPVVVTIHDVIPLVFPNWYPSGFRGFLKFQIQKLSLRGVKAVIADSENSKRDIVKYLGYPAEKVFVVYLAPGENFKKLATGNWQLATRKKYRLPEEFILYVGDVNYNKNILRLLNAFASLGVTNVGLVLIGKAFRDDNLPETKQIIQLIKELKLGERVLRLGWIPQDDLIKIYNLATVYCQPSLYEGFGLPILEAMACGCPVIAANTSSLPEVCGEAALLVNPNSEQEITQQLANLIHNEQMRQELIKKGFTQVKKFSWQKAALETIAVYEKVVSTR